MLRFSTFGALCLILFQTQVNAQCCGQSTGAITKLVANDETANAATELRSLEHTALHRGVLAHPEMSQEDYQRVLAAANRYAAEVAKEDDATFAAIASSSLQQAMAAHLGIRGRSATLLAQEPAPFLASAEAAPLESSVWDDPVFQANYRLLMDRAAKGDDLVPLFGSPRDSLFRIVGPGTRIAKDGEFADCVCVGQKLASGNRYCCTGTLVGRNVVVTAGHCFECAGAGSTAAVFIGNDTSQSGRTYVGTIHRHPDYGRDGKHHDLSVIVLSEDVTGVAPRTIATTEQIDRATFVRAVGFGNSNFQSTTGFGVKRLVDIPIASTTCQNASDPGVYGCDAALELVAGFVGLGPDSCNGDSGGPVYILTGNDARIPEAWRVAGATSRATRGAQRPCGDGGIYVRLDKYVDFIRSLPNARL